MWTCRRKPETVRPASVPLRLDYVFSGFFPLVMTKFPPNSLARPKRLGPPTCPSSSRSCVSRPLTPPHPHAPTEHDARGGIACSSRRSRHTRRPIVGRAAAPNAWRRTQHHLQDSLEARQAPLEDESPQRAGEQRPSLSTCGPSVRATSWASGASAIGSLTSRGRANQPGFKLQSKIQLRPAKPARPFPQPVPPSPPTA